jgi:hypothetical protein
MDAATEEALKRMFEEFLKGKAENEKILCDNPVDES